MKLGRAVVALALLTTLTFVPGAQAQGGADDEVESVTADIRDGQDAEPYSHPSVVALVRRDKGDNKGLFCHGTAVAKKWVVTAAHCFAPYSSWGLEDTDVVFGGHNLDDENGHRIEACGLVLHPDLEPGLAPAGSDIALVKLCDAHHHPTATMFSGSDKHVDEVALAVGWGRISAQQGDIPDVLQQGRMQVQPKKTCEKNSPSYVHADELCIDSDPGAAGSPDTCVGDSGGPLFLGVPNDPTESPILIGVLSRGSGGACGPAVYSRVGARAAWVQQNANIPAEPEKGVLCPSLSVVAKYPGIESQRYATKVVLGDDDFVGTDRGDVIVSKSAGSNTIAGGRGDDVICTQSGKDVLYGGAGDDFIFGGGGNDRISGGLGADVIVGANGADRLQGNAGADKLYGGPGLDKLFGNSGPDLLDGEQALAECDGGTGNNTLTNCADEEPPEAVPTKSVKTEGALAIFEADSAVGGCPVEIWFLAKKVPGALSYEVELTVDGEELTGKIGDGFALKKPPASGHLWSEPALPSLNGYVGRDIFTTNPDAEGGGCLDAALLLVTDTFVFPLIFLPATVVLGEAAANVPA